ncbi:MAG: RNA polymerase sigma factor [Treponema sp.]|nr:RNA polymerase sigma factor [Treponema sp.]
MNIEEAFKEYRDAMVRAMEGFCGDSGAAEDGVSHAFTQALVHRPMLEAMPEGAMKAWLYAAARNGVIDIKRKSSRLIQWGSYDPPDPRSEDTAARLGVEQILEGLSEPLRIPVMLKYYEGMNATEIGEAMELPAATVRTRLRTAMIKLRQHMLPGEQNLLEVIQ